MERLYTAVSKLEFLKKNGRPGELSDNERAFVETFPEYRKRFHEAMDDDLNTADAIGVLFELVRSINLAVEKEPSRALAKESLQMVEEMTDVLGLLYQRKTEEVLDEKVEEMIKARQLARKEKNFQEADRIRDELAAMSITLKDTPQGVDWSRS